MYTIEYSGDNIYTGDISETSDIKYVNVFNFDYSFITEKSIISDTINSTATVCFYKNKGSTIFPFGKYEENSVKFSNKTFYQDSDINHNLDNIFGYRSSFMFFGSSETLLTVGGNWGIKIDFNDVYGTVFSFWIYVNSNILYIKNNNNILYSSTFEETNLIFGFYNNSLVVNSENIITIDGGFLPYSFFVYGGVSDLDVTSKYSMPLVFEGTGDVIDDIYGDVYCITKPVSGLGYLKSKANNVLTLCDTFAFDIAFRAVGNSIPFSVSDGASFDGSSFIMDNASVWVEFDAVNDIFYSNILTTSGVLTISGTASGLNDYYLMRCYYKDNKFGTILNGVDTWVVCDNVAIFGGPLNILTYKTLIIDSFALYSETFPTQNSYDESLNKLTTTVSDTALVDSHNNIKLLFGVDNFYPKDFNYIASYSGIGDIPIVSSNFTYYTCYSIAGGEGSLSSDNFYVSRLPFEEDIYNCFVCENDKTFLTYFSGITVPINKIIAESFTNYDYVNDNFITTNSGLHIRNYSKVFNLVSSASVIEFSNIGWTDLLSIGVLFESDSIPAFPNGSCVAVTGNGDLYIGTTTTSGLNISSNTSIYFYLDNLSVVVSGSNTGILGLGVVANSYDYVKYFVRNNATDFATVNNIYVSTTQREIDTLTNKFFSYELPKYYDLDDSYIELFYNIGSSVSSEGITVYDCDFYDHQCSFSSYYDTTFSGMFNVSGYTFLGINDNFEKGFITERWRLVCDPYGVYGCNQPGWIPIGSDETSCCSSCYEERVADGNTTLSIYSSGKVLATSDCIILDLDATYLIDAVDIYVTSEFIGPETGFVISCDILCYTGSWITVLDDYVSPTLSGVSWPVHHTISIPVVRCSQVRLNMNSDWGQTVPTEVRPSCFYNYGGTAVCTTNGNTCLHVVLDDVLHVYSEYTLEDFFNSLSFSGINYYPFNSKLHLKNYSGEECYIKTDWTSSGTCNIIVSSGTGSIFTTVSGISDSVIYTFCASRNLDVIELAGTIVGGSSGNIYNSYAYSSDDLGLDLVFYNKDLPNVVGSGCLFDFAVTDYTVNFSSIATGYKYTALDGTDNITKAGVGFNTYPPSLLIDKSKGSYLDQSHTPCMELTSSGFQLVTNVVDNNIDINVDTKNVGGIQQVSKFNRLSLFSDYVFMPTIFYRVYIIGSDKNYTSFSDIASLVQTGDKVYFYPGSYTINTDKQITLIGVASPTEVQLNITNATNGLIVMGCTTIRCKGSGVFNMYNCYILPWLYDTVTVILYDVVNINFYNCDLYNYDYMSRNHSYVLLNKCTVYRSYFRSIYQQAITVYNEGYNTRGYYGYGPEFNRASIISGLSHVDSIIVSSFYHNARYNQFPPHDQPLVEKDKCNQLISSDNSYSVYFYGDIKKLNSFSMYLFIQDLDGKIEIENSSDFEFIVDSNNLNAGIHLAMNIYGLEIDMPVSISHSNVFRLAIVAVIFDGGSISIYLNGAKLATKYIIVTDFNDISSYLDDSILFFDATKFTCDGNGLLLKGSALNERVDFLVGTHIEDLDSGCSTIIKVNMEFTTYPVIADYHDNGTSIYYGYTAYNTGVGLYFNENVYEYEYIYFNASKSCKTYKNMTKKYVGVYKIIDPRTLNCVDASETNYISPIENDSILFKAARIDNHELGYCGISDPYGYVALDLRLPLPAISRDSYCFDTISCVIMVSFDLTVDPWIRDVGPNNLTCDHYYMSHGVVYSREGIFHKSIEYRGGEYSYINHNSVLNLNNNFTIEFLFSHYSDNGFSGYLLTKGTTTYNIAYRVGIDSKHVPYFKWSWEGDNTVYAERPIQFNDVTYLVIVVGLGTVSFYINGDSAGVICTDKLIIVDNSEKLCFVRGYYASWDYKKQATVEELCLLNRVKTKEEIEATWNTIGGGDNAPWIKINNVVIVSDRPIKVSPSDRFIEADGKIDISKWEYTSYKKPVAENGLILDSRLSKKIGSKVISYNVIFDVSIFCEFLEYSTNRDWSVRFKYRFSSGNYVSVVVEYIKYDCMYVKCEYYYNGYKSSTSKIKLVLSPCGIRFITDYNGYTYVQIGTSSFWYTLWTSTQKLFVETSGWLEVTLSNDDWDSWFIIKLTDFLPRLYCSSVLDGQTLNFYDAIPYGRAFYNQVPENIATLTLSNDVFEIDSNTDCIHSLEFINGRMQTSHVLNLNNNIFSNVNYETFNIELLVYLTYDNTKILDLFPWINIDVKDKYLYIVMNDNDRTIVDSISELLNDYVYIAVSLSNPHTTIHINNQKFIYDTNFVDILPYHFYPIGKNFSGRVVYFCGYYGDFDQQGYEFRVSSLSRYIGFDSCARKIFGGNMVTSLDSCSTIYAYNNPTYSTLLASTLCSISENDNLDIKVLFDPAILQSVTSHIVVIRCSYSDLVGKKTMSMTVTAQQYNVSHNYYDSFGYVGESNLVFSYILIGTCYDNTSVFCLDVDDDILEKILKGTVVLNIENNEVKIITGIYVYLNGELSINEVYGSSLLV